MGESIGIRPAYVHVDDNFHHLRLLCPLRLRPGVNAPPPLTPYCHQAPIVSTLPAA